MILLLLYLCPFFQQGILICPEDEGSSFIRNVRIYPIDYAAVNPRRQ
jgi:hypothetical protein